VHASSFLRSSLTLNLDNIIAALNTGSGKTLISILLIKWIASQDTARGKAIVFLVPRVTLVDQQADTISRRTSLKVVKIFGAMEIDLTNRARWKKRMENQDVFVMTREDESTFRSTF
jgi:endoribonuclease Dicer